MTFVGLRARYAFGYLAYFLTAFGVETPIFLLAMKPMDQRPLKDRTAPTRKKTPPKHLVLLILGCTVLTAPFRAVPLSPAIDADAAEGFFLLFFDTTSIDFLCFTHKLEAQSV